jgi:hypothetical protein
MAGIGFCYFISVANVLMAGLGFYVLGQCLWLHFEAEQWLLLFMLGKMCLLLFSSTLVSYSNDVASVVVRHRCRRLLARHVS